MAEGILSGKRGVVMGVANEKSIAWGCAQACAAQGASLIFNYLGESLEKRVGKLLEENLPGAKMLPCDVSNDDEIGAFFGKIKEEWGTIDFVIHSIAYADREALKGQYVATTRAQFAQALDISAFSLVAVSREAAPIMNAGGSIISMTYYGSEKVIPRYNVMGVAKAALEASTRYLAYDLGAQGIRVNSISAGPLRTLSASAISGVKHMISQSGDFTPLRRNITVEDVAGTAVYLLSDLASGVTGEVVHVDSGYHAMGMFVPESE